MNKLALVAAAALTVATFGAVAVAQDVNMESAFTNADANNDTTISYEEAQSAVSTLTQDQFKTADENGDGVLDEGEFRGLLTLFGNNDTTSTDTSSSQSSSEASSSESSSSAM